MKRTLMLPAFAVLLGTTCLSAEPGFFVGAAVGQASDLYAKGAAEEDSTGWKLIAGLRPTRYVGAELEYADLGYVGFSTSKGPGQAHVREEGLFAVGYLPISTSPVDVFAKLGMDHLHTNVDDLTFCQIFEDTPPVTFAFGGGMQLRFNALALRAEYERAVGSCGNPRLLSFGAHWTF